MGRRKIHATPEQIKAAERLKNKRYYEKNKDVLLQKMKLRRQEEIRLQEFQRVVARKTGREPQTPPQRADAAMTRLRGYQQRLRRFIRHGLETFLDSVIREELEGSRLDFPETLAISPPDTVYAKPPMLCVSPDRDDLEVEGPGDEEDGNGNVLVQHRRMEKWQSILEELHDKARDAHNIIYEAEGVTATYTEAASIVHAVQKVLVYLNEIYAHLLTGSLSTEWVGKKLAYQDITKSKKYRK